MEDSQCLTKHWYICPLLVSTFLKTYTNTGLRITINNPPTTRSPVVPAVPVPPVVFSSMHMFLFYTNCALQVFGFTFEALHSLL